MLPSAAQIDRALILQGKRLTDWVKATWHLVEPGPLIWGWHIDAICEHLEAVSRGEIKRLLINVPPGTSKSRLCGVFWPSWEWTVNDPSSRWICASYDVGLMLRDAESAHELLTSSWYRDRFLDQCMVPEDSAMGKYFTQAQGWRFSTSVDGKTTGWHADFQLIDDPHKPQEISKLSLDSARRWLRETMSSRWRNAHEGRRVIVMQRLHELDLSALAVEEGYVHLRLPMEYEKRYPCYTRWGGDPRVEEGELLCPDRFDAETVATMKKEMGSMVAAAQLQQRPVPEGGAIFRREWFKTWTELPKFDTKIISWDMAFKGTDTSDWVVGTVWGRKGSDYFLCDLVRGKWDFPRTLQEVEKLAKAHPNAYAKLVEDKANGPAVISMLEKRIPGLIAVNPEGGKEARANAVAPLVEAGNVYIPANAPWAESFVAECCSFPAGANDDQVDSMSQALTYLHAKATRIVEAMRKLQKMGMR